MNKTATFHLLEEHCKKYPQIQIQDLVKLLYQKEFGPGHMIEREENSLEHLIHEWAQLERNTMPQATTITVEEIGNGLVRVFLNSLEKRLLPILNKMFVNTANQIKGTLESFEKDLMILKAFCQKNSLTDEINTYLTIYQREGYPAKGHSCQYKTTYCPSYRVVQKSYIPFLEFIHKVSVMLQQQDYITIAIDGNCASGKSELSLLLSAYCDCNIIRMDDFFLPLEFRTTERMQEAGGNIHYERFEEEIVANWKRGTPISYRRFSCNKMEYQEQVMLLPKKLTVVEGSYSMRKEFRGIYDYTVFLSCAKEEQIDRIRKRNGEEMLRVFEEKWIPMENKYFREGNIKAFCDEFIYT